LASKYRWVVTGTPIHNKEFNIYAIMMFLQLHPFDDVTIWNKLMGTSNQLTVIFDALMLHRTKKELLEIAEVDTLPEKIFEIIPVDLNNQERFIYAKVMMISQSIFANYFYTYDQTMVYRKMAQQYPVKHKINSYDIFVLLMRLRQTCCHCGLIKQMVEHSELNESVNPQEDEDPDISVVDLIKQIDNLKLKDDKNSDVLEHWSAGHQVFNIDKPSSKIEKLMDVLQENVL
jgi:transcription termination factor 2